MDLNYLEESVKSNDVNKALSIIAEIGRNKYKEAVPVLIKYLQSTDNNTFLSNSVSQTRVDYYKPSNSSFY